MAYELPYEDLYIVDDDYDISSIEKYKRIANDTEENWNKIISLISQIRENGVPEGETAKENEEFANLMHTSFTGKLRWCRQ